MSIPLSIIDFAEDEKILNLDLYEKQKEILTSFWDGNYSIGVWALGRRSGKSLMASICAIYAGLMLSDGYKEKLRPNEKFYIVCVANSAEQSKIIIRNIKDLLNDSYFLLDLIKKEYADSLELTNNCVIKSIPTSSRTARGLPVAMLIFDEVAFSLEGESNAGAESLFRALSPAVAQFGNLGKILLISSPYKKQGLFWDMYRNGRNGKHQTIQAVNYPSWEVNPSLSKQFLKQEKARDPELFDVEYGANFYHSLNSFIHPDMIEKCVNYDRGILNSQQKYFETYYCSIDPSLGFRDAYAVVIAHFEAEKLIVDYCFQFQPRQLDEHISGISIQNVILTIKQLNQIYGFQKIIVDQFNSSILVQQLSMLNIEGFDWTNKNKKEAYEKLKNAIYAGNLELYNHPKIISELKNLQVNFTNKGNWTISGGTGAAVDDYVSCLAGIFLHSDPEDFDFFDAMSSGFVDTNCSVNNISTFDYYYP